MACKYSRKCTVHNGRKKKKTDDKEVMMMMKDFSSAGSALIRIHSVICGSLQIRGKYE
jgi:hypothetical protein